MGARPTIQEVREAIKASGYLMEQEVADVFESLNYRVITNWAYEDVDLGVSREMDAFAFKRIYSNVSNNFHVDIEFICECKNNSNPFIFIERSRTEDEIRYPDPAEYLFPIQTIDVTALDKSGKILSVSHVPSFQYLGLSEKHYYYQQVDKAVQFCKIQRDKDNWKASHEYLYDSILYPVVKALRYRQKELSSINSSFRPDRDLNFSDPKHIHLEFSIVVLSGDLYRINSFDRDIKPHETCHVSFTREFKAINLRGTFLIDFVRQDFLQTFIEEKIESFGRCIGELIETNPYAFMTREQGSHAPF